MVDEIKMRVLLIDDEPAVCTLVQSLLSTVNIEATIETDSMQAASLLMKEKFDAVFMDVHMPGTNGLELARIQRSGGLNLRTPIIMMTEEDGDPKLLSKAFEVGANFFLFKPIDETKLLRLVHASKEFIWKEKRRFQRVRVSLPITMEAEGVKIDATALDLSLGGLLVRAPAIMRPSSQVTLSLHLPDAKVPIRVRGKVLRVTDYERMGICFEDMAPDQRDALLQYLLPLILAEMRGPAS